MPASEMLDAAEGRIFEIAEMGITGDTKTLHDAIQEAYVRLDQRKQRGDLEYSGVPTGYVDLDSLTAGLQNSELIIVAARPSVGKTSYALNVVRHVVVDDTPGQNMLHIAANARRLKMRHDLRMVVIDYLQLIDPDNKRDSRQEQVAGISRRLKFLARELNLPVIALAQVNRSSEERTDH